jgi:alpha-glucosidase
VKQPHSALAVAGQEKDEHSMLAFYRHILTWRRQHASLIEGGIEFFKLGEPALAFRRMTTEGSMVCVFNLSPVPVTVTLSGAPSGTMVEAPSQGALIAGKKLGLGANGFAFIAEPAGAPAIGLAFKGRKKKTQA